MTMLLLGVTLAVVVLLVPVTEALSPPFLIYSATGGGGLVKGRDLIGGGRMDLVSHDFSGQSDTGLNGNCVRDVDYDLRRGLLYWTDECEGKIRKAALDSIGTRDVTVVLQQGGGAQIWGMAVDWVRNKLFYSDKTNNAIYVYDVATNTRQVFVSGGISDLRDVAVDPLNGWVYWTHGSVIERADLNGQSRETVRSSLNVGYLTIDYQNQTLYWTYGNIYSSSTDGSSYTTISVPRSTSRGVAYYNSNLYYAYCCESDGTNLRYATNRLTLSTGSVSRLGLDPGIQPQGHHVVALSRQPVPPGFECEQGLNDCDENAVCSDNGDSYTCTCRPGYTGNGLTCEDIDECEQRIDDCHSNARCTNTQGSFNCTCNRFFWGHGRSCYFDASSIEEVVYPGQTVTADDTTEVCPTNTRREGVLANIREDISSLLTNITSA